MTNGNPTLHSFPATGEAAPGQPPLLFVHGAYVDASCWELNFIPYFQARGYDCHALDLSGHGASGRREVNGYGLDDYVADIAEAAADLPEAPVLISHSMGCVVTQRFLAKGQARAAAFLAPVPPTGTGGSAARLALSRPDFFQELPKAVSGHADAHTISMMAAVYFSPDMPAREIPKFLPMIQPESERAVLELVNLPFRPAYHRPRIPVLAMNGGEDQVFPPGMLGFTAVPWNARSCVIPRAGHMLMLDPQWPEAAAAISDWLETLPPAAQ